MQHHGYGTRASNRTTRPAAKVGLAKKDQAEISAKAQEKRDKKAAHVASKAEEKTRKAIGEHTAAIAVAAMLDAYSEKEKLAIEHLDDPPSSQSSDEEDEVIMHRHGSRPGMWVPC